ncbi:MAG TPA: sigma-70 family RNA polymerase sigma factor [Kofleriaceae bacterium]|nr:sigma-70 family RNA polymerase sigma factor [Kofleriaceae bacterium]
MGLSAKRGLTPRPAAQPRAAEEDSSALVERAARGDRAAFGHLFRLYAPMVHGILLARVPSREARDLMQDVFVTALERLGSLRQSEAFGGWLAMIARNRATDFHRREQHRRTEPLADGDIGARDPDRAQAEEILAHIRQLPAAYSETLVLRLVQGMTGPEISQRVGITPDSVRVNLHRGMALLRQRLRQEEES